MAKVDLDKWLTEDDAIAIRIQSRDLTDFLGLNIFKSGTLGIPDKTVGLVTRENEGKKLLRSGDKVDGDFSVVLVKDRPLPLPFAIEGVRSSDDFPFDFEGKVAFSVDCLSPDAVGDFADGLLSSRDTVTSSSLRRFLKPHLEEVLRNFVAERSAEDLTRGDPADLLEKVLRSGLKRVFFQNGLDLEDVSDVAFACPAFEKLRDERLGAVIEEERARRLEIIREAWVKDQKNEAMSNKEMKEFVKALEHEGVLKDIERRREKARAERELQSLYEEEEQRRLELDLQNASQVMETLENAGFRNVFEKFLEIAEKRTDRQSGDDVRKAQAHGIRARTCHRLLLAAGHRVLAYDPARPGPGPAEIHDFTEQRLGMIRSVRTDRLAGETVLLVGAQFGGLVCRESEGFTPRAYPIPEAGDRRGGINAMVVCGERILATHSDYGLVSWPVEGGTGEMLRQDLTERENTVRGVRRGTEDRIYFATGKHIYSLLGENLEGTATLYEGADASITALWVTRAAVFGGTKSGELLSWKIGEPRTPRREIAKGADPIYMIRTALVDLRPSLLVGWKGYGVLAKVLETDSQVQYLSDARIRWVDGEADYIFGVDRDGRRVLVWKTGERNQRHREFITEDRIQNIWVWPAEAGEEA